MLHFIYFFVIFIKLYPVNTFYIVRLKYSSLSSTRILLKPSQELIPITTNFTASLTADNIAPELTSLLSDMPLQEKYSILIESFTKKLSQTKSNSNLENKKNQEVFSSIKSLYAEMISQGILPTPQSNLNLLNAAALLFNTATLGLIIQLLKSGGTLPVFGSIISRLSSPELSLAAGSDALQFEQVPSDNREVEVLYALSVFGALAVWTLLQVYGIFDTAIKPWGVLFGLLAVAIAFADVTFRSGSALRQATAGIDRLVTVDKEREAHCDSAAFLAGYLLGIPTFCYKADPVEALRLLQENPDTLQVYKQKKALELTQKPGQKIGKQQGGASAQVKSSGKSGEKDNFVGKLFGGLFQSSGKGLVTKNDSDILAENRSSNFGENSSNNRVNVGLSSSSAQEIINRLSEQRLIQWRKESSASSDMLSLGRILVWLMAPVAAEQLRYGRLQASDPRKSEKVLRVLGQVKSTSKPAEIVGVVAQVPTDSSTQDELLRWAYNEATLLIKQYGDVLEQLRGYVLVGGSSVGECVELIEQELSQ